VSSPPSRDLYGPDLAFIHHTGWEAHALSAWPRVARHLPRRGLVLDLGCGAGPLSKALVRRGCDVWGLDISPAMIALARRRVPRATFVCGSLDTTRLPRCDAAIAIGEILNYLPSLDRALHSVRAALRPGGVFVFDALLPRPRRTRYAARSGDGWALIAKIDESPTRVRRDIATFRDGRFVREVHEQRLHPAATVLRRLRAAGFRARRHPLDAQHALFVAVT
jgi:SAM-dependent methyltransferase